MKNSNTALRLKQLMKERNLKQIDIVRLAEPYCKENNTRLGRNDISQYVAGKSEPGQHKLYILGKALNVSEAWLMGYDVPMQAEQIAPSNTYPLDDIKFVNIPVIGSVAGTSTVTSFVESTSGVEVGGRTGLTAVTTGVCFLLSVFFSPLLSCVTSAVTAPALIIVGVLMAQQLKGIEWDNLVYAASGFMTVIFMILAYSISNGIAIGFITYTVSMIGVGKIKEIKPIVWILDVCFVIFLVFLPK